MSVPASLFAQIRSMGAMADRGPDKDAMHVMITTFKAPAAENAQREKGLGYLAAEEMRDKVEGAFPPKQIWVIPVDKINPFLTASGFSTTDALEPHDAKQLSVQIRADEYIAGTVARTAAGYRVEADLVLTRDINARQPLGVGEAPKLGDAIKIIVKEYKEARKQLDGEKKCATAARDQKYTEAIPFANAAIAAYPKSTLGRACLLEATYRLNKGSNDEVVKIAKDLAAIDSRSNTALKFILDAYDKAGPSMSDSLVLTLLKMMQNDPKNSALQIDAISRITIAKNPAVARPVIDSAVVQNPGDPDLLKLRWQILGAMKDWKEMFTQGQELVRLDTSFADTTYFLRTAQAYVADSAWQKAASAFAEGVKKFPTNAILVAFEIQMLQKAGQPQQALEKLDKAIAAKVPVPNAGAQKIALLTEMGKSELIVPTVRELIAAGDTAESTRQYVINAANAKFNASQALTKTDVAAADTSYASTLAMLAYSDSIATKAQKPQVAFLTGASSILLAQIRAAASQPTKSCDLAKSAKALGVDAMINLQKGGASAPKPIMDQLMGMAMQLDTQLDPLIKSYACK